MPAAKSTLKKQQTHERILRAAARALYCGKAPRGWGGMGLLDTPQPGCWERYGSPNDADRWQEQRYGF